MSLSENDRWLLSYYRSSEINGALFFGRMARTIRGPLQQEVTHHFADEATHAHYWTRCIAELGDTPLALGRGYQDQYLAAIGVPANLMEVMAITQVFEKRVIGQYRRHLRFPGTHPSVRRTIEKIMVDERWHIQYVRDALAAMADVYGEEEIQAALGRFIAADQEVYARTLAEYSDRIAFLAGSMGDTGVDVNATADLPAAGAE
jgi:bacterioferritin (cytochrome b1)